MDKKFAIFDMDGTIIDSMGFWKDLAAEYLRSRGIHEIPGDVLEQIKPMTMSESAALFKQRFSLSGDVEAQMNGMMDEHYREDIPLKPGVLEYLQSLHQKGVRMCVASATAEHLMESCLTRLGVRPYFEFLLSCETVGENKHSPRIFHEAARQLGAVPGRIAIYEDALYAVRTAKTAGFYVAGVYDEASAGSWQSITEIADEIIWNWEDEV